MNTKVEKLIKEHKKQVENLDIRIQFNKAELRRKRKELAHHLTKEYFEATDELYQTRKELHTERQLRIQFISDLNELID